ncbi:hypothetical protein FEM48_Zijuj02G0154800 [Ziziphus jujuba var. spinosa]|uniref:Protein DETOXIFICATION 12-like n=2 Tax=Ziziphus jujuba TaxID=326968 RepID=A0A978VWH4_ZIZJJ|nr:hypothetical protein FEM48_Zijuj02G0154800 [Ziziphus jujuba var. spinosa]
MASALETLCGQAYGAEEYKKLGLQTYTAIFSLFLVCFPVTLIWINMAKVLTFTGQDPLIAQEAGKFTIWLVPALFAYAPLQPLIRYFQMQSLIIPMLISSCATLLFHIPLCRILVFKSGLNSHGGALAIGISNWLNVILLGLYMNFSSACERTRSPVSVELFHGVGQFFRLAIPSALMVCTRVSNELGAGNPQAARIATCAVMFLAVAETSIVSTTLFFTRRIFGYTFSNEKEVVDYVTKMAPLVCLNAIFDSLQGVLSGVARGCGWQHIGAYINLSAFYLCGIPVAAILGFWFQLRGEGLWIGIQLGSFMQTVLLSLVTISTDWEKQVYIYIPYLLVQTGRNNEKRKKKANSQIQEEEHRA